MEQRTMGILFPGQGAFFEAALRDARYTYPVIADTFEDVDRVAREQFGGTVSEIVYGSQHGERSPWILQLAIYGIDVAVHRALEAEGLQPGVLVGHSFGEIAALTCAGAFSVEDGAAIVCQRVRALAAVDTAGGSMASLETDAVRAAKLADLIGDERLAVAAENHVDQAVLSGPGKAMDAAHDVAKALGIPFVPLQSPLPFHCPLLQPAVPAFAAAASHVRQRPLRLPVFSPILQRYYTDGDVLSNCLAEHLVQPVRFLGAIRRLHAEGMTVFVESGASEILCKLVARILASHEVTALACLRDGQPDTLDAAVRRLRADGFLPTTSADSLPTALLPGVAAARFWAFWADCGPQVAAHVRHSFEQFERDRESPPDAPAPPPPAGPPNADTAVTRQRLFQELSAMYAAALEYPEEVFTEGVLLEADLGIDSVKQAELLARVRERYSLAPRPADFRLADYSTMGRLTDLVLSLTAGAAR